MWSFIYSWAVVILATYWTSSPWYLESYFTLWLPGPSYFLPPFIIAAMKVTLGVLDCFWKEFLGFQWRSGT